MEIFQGVHCPRQICFKLINFEILLYNFCISNIQLRIEFVEVDRAKFSTFEL